MTNSLIGLTGYMRTGKDSVAALLVAEGYTKLGFADPLRDMAYAIDPTISLEGVPEGLGLAPFETSVTYTTLLDTIGYEAAKSIPDVRRFLQRLGTEGVRGVLGDSTWVDIAKERALAITRNGGKVVFNDVRFPNEADAIHDLGGEVWRTVRPGHEGSGHASETALDAIVPDRILVAESLDQLAAAVQLAGGFDVTVEDVNAWKESILA